MEKQTLPVVAKLLPVCLTIAFTALASAQIAPPGGGGGGAYGWRLIETTPIGKDVINTWRTLPTGAVAPLILTREWGSDNWVTDEGLALGWQFPGFVSNSGFEPRPVSMTSSGTTRFKFKYFPAPGETPPSRAVFRVSPVSMVTAWGGSALRSATNGFSDSLVLYEPPMWASTGKHLLERSVGSDGTVVITLPSRRAEASSSGFNAGVWADASQSSAAPDHRRVSITLPNFRSEATGNVLTAIYTSAVNGPSQSFSYPEYRRVPTRIKDSETSFNKAVLILGNPVIAIKRIGVLGSVPNVSLAMPGQATVESLQDRYFWMPNTGLKFPNPGIEPLFFEDHETRKWDAIVSNYSPANLYIDTVYESPGIGQYNFSLEYWWDSDGAKGRSDRTLAFVNPVEEIARSVFTDLGNDNDPVALSEWIPAHHSIHLHGEPPVVATIAGSSIVAITGIAAAIYSSVPLAILAAAAGLIVDFGNLWSVGSIIAMPRELPSYEPAFDQPEPQNWRALLGGYSGAFNATLYPHFAWRIYYVRNDDVTLTANNFYDLFGYRNQQTVSAAVRRPPHRSTRQMRYWLEIAGEPPL